MNEFKTKYKTLIIFDWDDTLFPTTWIVRNNINLSEEETKNKFIVYFSKLDMLLYKIFSECMKYGTIFIVTNASFRWVETSSEILPNTKKLLNKYIKVISARDRYQEEFPTEVSMWKKLSFQDLVSKYFNKFPFQQIISIGDADHEFYALIDLYNESSITKHRLLKTIRLIREPQFDFLIDQLEVLNKSIHKILKNKNHMDLTFKNKT
jgi:hypothetical protein